MIPFILIVLSHINAADDNDDSNSCAHDDWKSRRKRGSITLVVLVLALDE